MQQNKTPFFVIIGLAIVGVIGMVVARPFLTEPLNLPAEPQTTTIRVVAAASIKPWVDQAAQEFNLAHPKSRVEIVTASGLIPEKEFAVNPQVMPPAAWLAEATFVTQMNSNLSFGDMRPVASASLAWGTFKQQDFQKYGGLTWEALHKVALDPNFGLKVVIASPKNSAEGLAALIAATAGHLNKPTLTAGDVTSANAWLTETFKESTRASQTLGPKPAEALATRGASVGNVGLLTLASWRSAGLGNRPDFTITPTQPAITLDYPFAIWSGAGATPEGQRAAAAFRDFLLTESQQKKLADFFFDRAGAAANGVQVDGQAALSLQRWAERELR